MAFPTSTQSQPAPSLVPDEEAPRVWRLPKHTAACYPEARFGGFTDIDGTVAFYTRVNALLTPSSVAVDVGCGRGAYAEDPVQTHRALRILRGRCAHVIGLDVDQAAATNPYVDEFHLLDGPRWPLPDAAADLCLCDNVLEHLQEPGAFLDEFRRVLRPGGYLCLRTPNALNYVALISRSIPNRYHARLVGRSGGGRREEDVFPTYYACNTVWALRRALCRRGFEALVYGHEAEPSYLHFSPILYRLGVLHQRLAPRAFRAALFAFARKGE